MTIALLSVFADRKISFEARSNLLRASVMVCRVWRVYLKV